MKIANRNFNVYRECFTVWSVCLFEAGIPNPTFPTNCISLPRSAIRLEPNDTNSNRDNARDNDDSTFWEVTPSPTSQFIQTGVGVDGVNSVCWKPYDQWIWINFASLGITSFSSIGYV